MNADPAVAGLVEQLSALRDEIRAARAALAPLEAGLSAAEREYHDAVAAPQREAARLRAELAALDEPVGPHIGRNGGTAPPPSSPPPATPVSSPPDDPEAVDKSILAEHLFRVLDGMDAEGGEVIAEVQGLVDDPRASLADALEHVPWGPAWTHRSAAESVTEQAARLRARLAALTRQRDALRNAAAKLETDVRYGLWRRREAGGPEAWAAFLHEAGDALRRENAETAALIDERRGGVA